MQILLLWVFFGFIAAVALFRGIRAIQSYGAAGISDRVSLPTKIAGAVIIVIALGLFAATHLGFIPNHAP